MSDKIRPHELERTVIFYVRSRRPMVLHNRESGALQYAIRDRLIAVSRNFENGALHAGGSGSFAAQLNGSSVQPPSLNCEALRTLFHSFAPTRYVPRKRRYFRHAFRHALSGV